MKNTLIIIAHPDISKSVVNRYWGEALTGKVAIRYLQESCPLEFPLDVASEQAILEQYDRIVFQFPLYWYGAPAVLKRWLDEVMTFGWAYGTGGDKMEGRELGVAVSCGGKESEFSEGGIQLHSLEYYMSQYEGTAAFIRSRWLGYHSIYDTFGEDLQERLPENAQQYLAFLEKE